MRQVIMTSPGKIELREVTSPGKLAPNEILLKIKRIGVCGSDIHVYHGEHPFTPYPVVQGHEYSATVEAVGSVVTKVNPGDYATARPQLVCGECRPCRRGDYNVCESLRVQGFQAPGCAQDYFVVPEERIIPFPKKMTFEQGAMIEPASVGAHSTSRVSDLKNKNVVVFGAGTIGNMVAQFVQARGAKKVLITDLSEFRLEKAKACGILNTSNAKNEEFPIAIKRVFGDEGFQVAIEAVGVEPTITAAVKHIEKGGEIIILGVFGFPPKIDLSVVCEHEIKLIGSMMYKHEDYKEAVKLISTGKIKTEPLVTRHFPLEHYDEAYKFIDAQGEKTMKVMIDL